MTNRERAEELYTKKGLRLVELETALNEAEKRGMMEAADLIGLKVWGDMPTTWVEASGTFYKEIRRKAEELK